jgi:hypothetical protein
MKKVLNNDLTLNNQKVMETLLLFTRVKLIQIFYVLGLNILV